MKDLLIEQQSNKFVVDDHRWRFSNSRLEYLTQKIRHTISIFKNEWFFDRLIGIPYIPDDEDDKVMHRRMIETAVHVRIGEIDGVIKFIAFSSSIDKETRKLTVEFTVQIDTGEVITERAVL